MVTLSKTKNKQEIAAFNQKDNYYSDAGIGKTFACEYLKNKGVKK